MSNPKPSSKAAKLIREYGNAREQLSWIGNCHPDEHDAIRVRFHKARQKLCTYVALLELELYQDKERE